MSRNACLGHARVFVRRSLVILCCGAILWGTVSAADLPGLDKNETKNVELVVKNLGDLVQSGGDLIRTEKGVVVKVPSGSLVKKVAAFADVDDYRAVLENLKAKLKGKNLHSVPGLSEKTPPKYSLGDPTDKANKPGHPRAAYCVPHTFVKIGNAWVPCPERDIIVDKPILDPPGAHGQPIDETTDQGWKDKWTLLHVLVHEKWHERMMDEQMKLAGEENQKPGRTEAKKKENLEEAEKKGASPDAHEEVYMAQKKVLYLKWEILKRRAKTAAGAEKKKIEAQMKWILDEVANIESSMAKALKEKSEFELVGCGAGDVKNGTLAVYVVLGTGYWRLDVDVAGGRAVDYRVPELVFWGTRHYEDAVTHEPSLYVAMPQRVYTALRVQAEPCRFFKDAEEKGLVHRGATFGAIGDDIPVVEGDEAAGGSITGTLVGVVLPRDARPGETVSGSLTLDPHAYEEVPAFLVRTLRLPLPRNDAGQPVLEKVGVDPGTGPQSARGPITLRVPENGDRVPIRLVVRTGGTDYEERPEVVLPRGGGSAPAAPPPGEYRTQTVCVRGSVQAIWGPLGGDASRTRVEVDGVPATIVAETPRAVYWLLPDRTGAGRHRLVLRDGGRSAAFDVFVMTLEMSADQLNLQRGQSTRYHVRLRVGDVPASAWKNGFVAPDLVDPAALAKKVPDHRFPSAGQPGEILFVLTNASPRTITGPDMPGGRRVFHLTASNFPDGVFSTDGAIQSIASGGFVINGLAVAALEPADAPSSPEAQNESDTPEARRIRIAYERLQRARSAYHRAIEKTRTALEKGKAAAPKDAVEKFENAERASHQHWHTLVQVSAKYDADKSEANKKALDEAEKKMGELDDATRDAKQAMIDGMSKEARKAYYDAEDAERSAGHELSEAGKEYDSAITK